MHRWCPTLLVCLTLAVCLVLPAAAAPQRAKWWQSEEVRNALELTDDTSATLEEIFRATRPALQDLMQKLKREERTLSDLIRGAEVGEAAVLQQIDRVEEARSALSRTRILMLYRMHRELSVGQRDALREWMRHNRHSARRSRALR